ncbi:MAG: undecaprenyl/decaprenyl-phosphate alpha-N-acetylglucosaminyl 1-phosphate transferase [Actinobacteria bacterium]|nr:undecaprenyl/decaprenyl-phosphate alpha-N-acetylglucosaminyl 1-phosphate transferase [Actinomycetota bacterium]
MKAFLELLGISRPTGSGWISVVITFLLAAVATWLFIPAVRAFSLQAGWADEPNQRRINKVPVPNAGGLAVYAGALAALILATLLRPIVVAEVQAEVLAILLGGSVLMITGFIDDQFSLPPIFRLVVQVLAALLLIATGIRINVAFGGDWAPVLSGLFTVLWVVAITNAINLIDGVDGLAGGVSFIVGMSLLAVAAQFTERAASTILLAAVSGAALGFLRHNFHPSAIILGDSGAYFLGFVLAATSILGGVKVTTVAGLIPTGLFLLLPVADTVQVFFRRLAKRKNPLSAPGKDHLHHHLLRRGFSQRRTALILWGVTLATNLVAMAVQGIAAVAIVTTGVGIVVLLSLVVWRKWLAASLTKGVLETED